MITVSRLLGGAALLAGVIVSIPAYAQDLDQAGVSAAVRGDVQVARSDAVGRQINGGEAIFLRDAITSGADSGMQIMLMDETVFTIGQNSEITIDEFVYDPVANQGSLSASMAKGVMRFVTGNIAAGTPENMTIKLPVGTIGIRGTDGVVAVLTPQQAQQQFPNQAGQLSSGGVGQPVVFAALNGPGPLSALGSGTGSFNFATPDGSVDLNRPGGAVLATPGQPPIFFIAPPGAIQEVTSGLRGQGSTDDEGEASATEDGAAANQPSEEDSGSGDNASDESGSEDGSGNSDTANEDSGSGNQNAGPPGDNQGGGLTGDGGATALGESGVGNDASFGQVTQISAETETQNSANTLSGEASAPGSQTIQFSDVFTGAGSIDTGTVSINSNGISFDYSSTVDFGNRSISAGGSNINDAGIGGGMTGGSFSISGNFGDFNGNAVFGLSDVDSFGGNCDVHCTNLQIQFTDPTTQTINLGVTPLGGNSETTATQSGIVLD